MTTILREKMAYDQLLVVTDVIRNAASSSSSSSAGLYSGVNISAEVDETYRERQREGERLAGIE